METGPDERVQKKTWEYCSFIAYPYSQALALPLYEDKQRKASPRRVDMHIHTTAQLSQTYTYTDKPR